MSLVTVFGSIGANGRMQGRHNGNNCSSLRNDYSAYLGIGRIPASVREKQVREAKLKALGKSQSEDGKKNTATQQK